MVINFYEGISFIVNFFGFGGNGFDVVYDDYGICSLFGFKVDEGYIF